MTVDNEVRACWQKINRLQEENKLLIQTIARLREQVRTLKSRKEMYQKLVEKDQS